MATWIAVAPEVARQHPLYGIRGWLLLKVLGLLLGTPIGALATFAMYAAGFTLAAANTLAARLGVPAESTYRAAENLLWISLVTWTLLVELILIAASSLFLAAQLFGRSATFIRNYNLLIGIRYLGWVIFNLVVYLELRQLGTNAVNAADQVGYAIGRAAPGIALVVGLDALWLTYVNFSRRVRVTTRNEISASDSPYAIRGPTEALLTAPQSQSGQTPDPTPSTHDAQTAPRIPPQTVDPGYSLASPLMPPGLLDTPEVRRAYAQAILMGNDAAADFVKVMGLLGPGADAEDVL
jgi:hypothetical protein